MVRDDILNAATQEILNRRSADDQQFSLLIAQATPGNVLAFETIKDQKNKQWTLALQQIKGLAEPSSSTLDYGHIVEIDLRSEAASSNETHVLIRDFPAPFDFNFHDKKICLGMGAIGYGGTLLKASVGSTLNIPGDGRGIPAYTVKVLRLVSSN